MIYRVLYISICICIFATESCMAPWNQSDSGVWYAWAYFVLEEITPWTFCWRRGALPGEVRAGSCINWKVFGTSLESFGVVFGVWSLQATNLLPKCQYLFWAKVRSRPHDSKIVCEKCFSWLTDFRYRVSFTGVRAIFLWHWKGPH